MKNKKTLKDELKKVVDSSIRKEIDEELDELVSDEEYKMLRKAARNILDDILKMPRKGTIDADDVNGEEARMEYYKEK